MCRYLNSAQVVPIYGLHNSRSICCAVTLRQTLYVTVPDITGAPFKRVFVYDLDDSNLRHENPHQRKITCSNRHPLVLDSLVGSAELLVPCPHSNTLYVLENDHTFYNNAVVHRVTLDGTELLRWSLDLQRHVVNSMTLNPSGSYLAITSKHEVNVYDTVNGHLVDTEEVTDQNLLNDEIFVTAAFQDDSIDNIVTVTSQGRYRGEILASDDHQCLLMMKNSNFRLFDKTTTNHRDITIKRSFPKRYPPTHHWYDRERGLVFCIRQAPLRVVRVTL